MKLLKNILISVLLIVTVYVTKSSAQSFPGTMELGAKLGVRKKILSDSINHSFVQIDYRVDSGRIVFFFNSKDFAPGIQIDFNNNSALDENIDKQYGTTGGNSSQLCVTYLLTKESTTPCGDAASHATMSLKEGNYEFNIPLNEVKYYTSGYVLCKFTFWNSKTGSVSYPAGDNFNFWKIYKIWIPSPTTNQK